MPDSEWMRKRANFSQFSRCKNGFHYGFFLLFGCYFFEIVCINGELRVECVALIRVFYGLLNVNDVWISACSFHVNNKRRRLFYGLSHPTGNIKLVECQKSTREQQITGDETHTLDIQNEDVYSKKLREEKNTATKQNVWYLNIKLLNENKRYLNSMTMVL